MESALRIWTTNRNIYKGYLEKYSLEQLNTVPPGFSNNLIWNIGHIIVVQQRIIYALSGLPMHIPDELVERYKGGTRPTGTDTQETADKLGELLISLADTTRSDFDAGKFSNTEYKAFTTVTGFSLGSTEDAFHFNNYHEGMHLGFMMNIRKFI